MISLKALMNKILDAEPEAPEDNMILRDMEPPEKPPWEGIGVIHVIPDIDGVVQHWGQRGKFQAADIGVVIRETMGKYIRAFLSDRTYLSYSLAEVCKFISIDDTSYKQYVSEYFDCDDFAQVLAGKINSVFPGIAFGTIWYNGRRNKRNWGHAVNLFYDDQQKQLFMIEPQNDKVYKWSEEWRVALVMI